MSRATLLVLVLGLACAALASSSISPTTATPRLQRLLRPRAKELPVIGRGALSDSPTPAAMVVTLPPAGRRLLDDDDASSSGPEVDPTMFLDPARDSVRDKYPLGFKQEAWCYDDVPTADMITAAQQSYNYYGWPLTHPPNCGANTRQVTFNDRFPVAASQVTRSTPVATYWGLSAGEIAAAKITTSYAGLKPALVTGQLLKVALFSPGAGDFDLEYAAVLNKIPATHGWLTSSVELSIGDGIWLFDHVPHEWRQQGLYFQYRVKDFAQNIKRLTAANANPEHPYYQKLDLNNIWFFGHSDGAVAALNAWVGNPFPPLFVAPLDAPGIQGVLPLMDPGLWAYPYSNLTAVASDIKFAALWSQNQMYSQGFWRLHDANHNQLVNNHLLLNHAVHEEFQLDDCNLNAFADQAHISDWDYPGVSAPAYCVKPPYDLFMGPMLPKVPLQQLANVMFAWYDRFLTAVEINTPFNYQVQYSTVAVNEWQATLPPGLTIHYGRWHCGNVSMANEPRDDEELARGEHGYSYSADALDSYVSELWYVDGPGTSIWGYDHPEWDGSGRPATTVVQPRYIEDLVPTLACGCLLNPLC